MECQLQSEIRPLSCDLSHVRMNQNQTNYVRRFRDKIYVVVVRQDKY